MRTEILAEITEVKAQIEQLEAQLTASQGQLADLQARLDDLMAQLNALDTQQAVRIGPCYHTTTKDFDADSFLADYHRPSVRAKVRQQLFVMAQGGCSVIKTSLFIVTIDPRKPRSTWKWHFPPNAQELANLHAFAQDVADLKGNDGQRVQLIIALMYLWSAEYRVGHPSTKLGHSDLTEEDYNARMTSTYTSVIDAVKGAAEMVYFCCEAMVDVKENEAWLLQTHYPAFCETCDAAGITPSVYFLCASSSLRSPLASLRWMQRAGLRIPARIDLSVYPGTRKSEYPHVLDRMFGDAVNGLKSLGLEDRSIGVVETLYPVDAVERRAFGAGFRAVYEKYGEPQLITFWTTPWASSSPDALQVDPTDYTTEPPWDFDAFSIDGEAPVEPVEPPVEPVEPPAALTGIIYAKPNPVPISSSGLGTTLVRWELDRSDGPPRTCRVGVRLNGGDFKLFAESLERGGSSAEWIQAGGRTYTFELLCEGQYVDSVTVVAAD